MNRRTFYQKLRKYRGLFDWSLNTNGAIRGLRKDCPSPYKNILNCPITAVLWGEKCEFLYPFEFHVAGERIGINQKDQQTIAKAADNLLGAVKGNVINVKQVQTCRKTIKKILFDEP